ncbi:MAG: UDP-3-O-(3-hydroxymyristoyl)glucosamine N-acyltransferase [Phycisphaerae bacterium]|nr:UDP-3-O-(3-hydroxymyristoyl)glucosamine N-acyltransferase [Phycisphaerae bacterium]
MSNAASSSPARTISVGDLASRLKGELSGSPDLVIDGLETVFDARQGQLTFIGDERHAQAWTTCGATAAIVSKKVAKSVTCNGESKAIIVVDDADIAMIAVLEDFAPAEELPPIGVHPTAAIDPTASIGPGARIGPFVSVGPRSKIGANVAIFAGTAIYCDVSIGDGSVLHANVVVRERCVIGRGVILHGGVQIGSDGFGYRPSPDGRGILKVPHLGNVVIGDAVEIGANSCVDRGKFGATSIGAGTKIDNLVQIGHNCRIGRGCIFSGQVGIAGSTTIGDGALIGGGVGFADHLVIGKGVKVAARSGVMNNIPDGETWGGYPAKEIRRAMQEEIVSSKLPEYLKNLKHILGPEAARVLDRGPQPPKPPVDNGNGTKPSAS